MNSLPIRFLEKEVEFLAALRERLRGMARAALCVSSLTAIDFNTGRTRWRIPLCEFKELTEKSIPSTGTENYGGSIVATGGLLFITATRDEMIRAYDRANGVCLWQNALPAPGFATLATYLIDGKQFVVIAAGGGKLGSPEGDAYVAYALP